MVEESQTDCLTVLDQNGLYLETEILENYGIDIETDVLRLRCGQGDENRSHQVPGSKRSLLYLSRVTSRTFDLSFQNKTVGSLDPSSGSSDSFRIYRRVIFGKQNCRCA
jgi:hypothetical protein